jgi:hypothetical protein
LGRFVVIFFSERIQTPIPLIKRKQERGGYYQLCQSFYSSSLLSYALERMVQFFFIFCRSTNSCHSYVAKKSFGFWIQTWEAWNMGLLRHHNVPYCTSHTLCCLSQPYISKLLQDRAVQFYQLLSGELCQFICLRISISWFSPVRFKRKMERGEHIHSNDSVCTRPPWKTRVGNVEHYNNGNIFRLCRLSREFLLAGVYYAYVH